MNALDLAKNKLNEMRRALENGDTSIMPDELKNAQNAVAALENNNPGLGSSFGELTPQGIAEMEKQGLMTPALRMSAGYQETEKKQNAK